MVISLHTSKLDFNINYFVNITLVMKMKSSPHVLPNVNTVKFTHLQLIKGGGCGLFVDWRYDLIFAVDLVIWTLNSCRFDDLEIGVDGDLASLKL